MITESTCLQVVKTLGQFSWFMCCCMLSSTDWQFQKCPNVAFEICDIGIYFFWRFGKNFTWASKRVSEWLLFNANSAIFLIISWREQVNFQWDNDEIRFVLDQHDELDIYSETTVRANQSLLLVSDWCLTPGLVRWRRCLTPGLVRWRRCLTPCLVRWRRCLFCSRPTRWVVYDVSVYFCGIGDYHYLKIYFHNSG